MRQRSRQIVSWEPAINNVNRMERAMVNVMVRTDMTYNDALDCLIQPEPLKLLRDAFPHFSGGSGDQFNDYEFPAGKVTLYFDMISMGVVPCQRKVMVLQHTAPHILQLTAMMDKMLGICSQLRKLRRILHDFHDKQVTPGAARHYWPTLQSLLPADHDFFRVKGDRFKDVFFDHATVELLREAPEIVAKGLLCDPNTNGGFKRGKTLIRAITNSSQMHYLFVGKET
jgi:hypothetical protein